MAWNTPASFSVGEIVAASKLNLNIRDNLRYLKGLDGTVNIDTSDYIVGNSSGAIIRVNSGPGSARAFSLQTSGVSRFGIELGGANDDLLFTRVNGGTIVSSFQVNRLTGLVSAIEGFRSMQGPGGFQFFGASGVSTTPVTIVPSGVSRRVSGFITAWHSGGTGGGTQFNVGAGTTTIYNDGSNLLSTTVSAGQLTVFRSAGSGTFDVTLMFTYQ